MTKPVAAIVVTYNRLVLLEECIAALLAQTDQSFDVLIIDNASTDGTGERMKDYVRNGSIQYFNTGKNSGGAGGFNYGLRKAYELGYEYFWLMDDDTIPTETALEELLKAKAIVGEDFGFLCSYAVWTDGNDCLMNVPSKKRGVEVPKHLKDNGISQIDRATFVSFFVSRPVVEKVGLPIKEFFIWADDTNYCLRIREIAQGYYAYRSKVVHKMATNIESNVVFDDVSRLPRYVYNYRNVHFNRRYEHRLPKFFWHVIKRFGRIIISAKNHKADRIKYMLKGVWQGFFFHPEIEYVNDLRQGE